MNSTRFLRLVQEANQTNSTIVMGKLKGIRKNHRGRRFNRKLNSLPYYKLSSYIKYKAESLGIPVITVNEAYTSQACSICGGRGVTHNGLFKCCP